MMFHEWAYKVRNNRQGQEKATQDAATQPLSFTFHTYRQLRHGRHTYNSMQIKYLISEHILRRYSQYCCTLVVVGAKANPETHAGNAIKVAKILHLQPSRSRLRALEDEPGVIASPPTAISDYPPPPPPPPPAPALHPRTPLLLSVFSLSACTSRVGGLILMFGLLLA